MELSSFTNFYERNQSDIDKLGIDITKNLLGSFIKKGDDKPKNTIQPSPKIIQAAPAGKNYDLYIAGAALAMLAVAAIIAFKN